MDGVRPCTLLEELDIEASIVEHRRGELYRLAAKRIRELEAVRPEETPTVSADSHDELPPMVCIARASGEGVTDWKLCRNEAEIRAAYVAMVCGIDDEHHKEEIDGIMEAYRGDGWRGDTLKIDLYCASFTLTRFPAGCLPSPQKE